MLYAEQNISARTVQHGPYIVRIPQVRGEDLVFGHSAITPLDCVFGVRFVPERYGGR